MGYTHYWKRKKEIPADIMKNIVDDFRKTLPYISEQTDLADGNGKGSPKITYNVVSFNGKTNCGHPDNKPCGGDCSHETFLFHRIMRIEKWQESQNQIYREVCDKIGHHIDKDFYFEFCKTALKPYDIAVTVFLVIAKHYLKDEIVVTSDGKDQHWWSAKYICYMALDYGMGFELTEEGLTLRR